MTGSAQAAAPAAHAWAIAAATAAIKVPASNAEAAAWAVRGWADVAVGCLALDGPACPVTRPGTPSAFGGLDEVVRSVPVASGGQDAARLRGLRRFAGPVPCWYPDSRPAAGPIRAVRPVAWRAAGHLAGFGEFLMRTAAGLPWHPPCARRSARQLAWGARYRPSASDVHVTMVLPVDRWLARRTWMCLPGLPGPGTAVAEVPSTATPLAQQIWRGIHEGAHLDHLNVLARPGSSAPSPAEFGAGLLIAESYAMAVEILAAIECILAGEGEAVWQLGAGLVERATRLPGGSHPAPEFADLPTLAEVYVLGPLEVLAGGATAQALPGGAMARALPGEAMARALPGEAMARALPAGLIGALRGRWCLACAAYPPAAAFGSAATELLSRSSGADRAL